MPATAARNHTYLQQTVARGINVSGAEFTSAANPSDVSSTVWGNTITGTDGTDFHYDSRSSYSTYTDISSMQWLYQQGFRTLKYNLAWERIQPTISGALNSTHVGYVNAVLTRAASVGMRIVLDIHNYGQYYMDGAQTAWTGDSAGTCYRRSIGGDDGHGNIDVPISAFVDLWTRMTDAFCTSPALFGFALMNEPQGSKGNLVIADWKSAAQQAVTAVRQREAANGVRAGTLRLYVGGFGYSDCYQWSTINGASGWVSDPGSNMRYEAHHYWSQTDDGQYTTYAAALTYAGTLGYTAGANPDAMFTRIYDAVDLFRTWLTNNSAKGCIGEFSWPRNADVTGNSGDAAKWAALGDAFLTRLDSYGIDSFGWSCGEFYGQATADQLPMYLRSAGPCPPNRLSVKQGQAATLEAHPEFLT